MSAVDLVIDDVLRQNRGFDAKNRMMGGEPTKFGVSLDLLRCARSGQVSNRILEELTEPEARLIYREILRNTRLDQLRDMELMYWCLDAIRHHGTVSATRLLLLAGKLSVSLTQLGPEQINAINSLPASAVLRRLQAHRLHLIGHVIANHPERIHYAPTWIDRACEVLIG